jgi:hypothetical protein
MRNNHGNMFLLIVCIIVFVFAPLFWLISQLGPFMLSSQKTQKVVDAAGLLAARDLSQIVFNDPNFGYVSLSNYSAGGTATRALDGECLPVVGINTLVGTLRQNAIIANNLHNENMSAMVSKDTGCLGATVRTFNTTFADLLSGQHDRKCFDMNGVEINPLQDVHKFLTDNLPSNTKLKSLTLSLGWLEGGSDTATPVPQPAPLAMIDPEKISNGQYQAFTNYPVAGHAFTFAGLGGQAHLVSNHQFRPADNSHICTIILMQCVLETSDQRHSEIISTVCSQPYAQPDTAIRGAMTVRFSGHPIPGLLSWNEFLSSGNFYDRRVNTFDVVAGDYPFDKKAQMRIAKNAPASTTAQQYAEHLYSWLRNGRLTPHIDAVMSMLSEPFTGNSNEVYCYEMEDNGSISRKLFDGNNFTRPVIAQGQVEEMSDTKVRTGQNAIIIFRDSVNRLGTSYARHAGQPLAGYPLNSSGRDANYDELAQNFSKRNQFHSGLALDIEIGDNGTETSRREALSMMRPRYMSRSKHS